MKISYFHKFYKERVFDKQASIEDSVFKMGWNYSVVDKGSRPGGILSFWWGLYSIRGG